MASAKWPPYGSNFSSGVTDAIGILVETFNDCETALRFILLSFMRGKIWHNYMVVEQMSSTAVVEAILGYLIELKYRRRLEVAIRFSIKSFEACRVNRNSIIHFGIAWRIPRGHKTRLVRTKLKAGRYLHIRHIKAGDVRRVADACHELKIYMDNLSVAMDELFRGKPFKEPERPKPVELLEWTKQLHGTPK